MTERDIQLVPENGEGSAPHDELRYIVIEGVIGVGKTTLASLLADRFRAQLVLEEFEENPFLERFYSDPPRWAFQTQLAFLASRFHQQKSLAERSRLQHRTVSDYAFDKDRIFAYVNLAGDELELYEKLYEHMEPVTPVPDLIVYLRAGVDRLMRNIMLRGRPYEANMQPGYIQALSDAYDHYFQNYTKSPLLVVDASPIDFVHDEHQLNQLIHRITNASRMGAAHSTTTSRA